MEQPGTNISSVLSFYEEEEFLQADGFDEAIIGVDQWSMRLIYSVSKCIAILRDEGMTEEEALEHFHYNVSGAYVGDKTPIWAHDEFLNYD
jgi:hypothetical protein